MGAARQGTRPAIGEVDIEHVEEFLIEQQFGAALYPRCTATAVARA
jgi:hypothetical protein